MKHKIIRLTAAQSDEYIDNLAAKNIQLTDGDYDPELLITEYCTVLKPNGDPLLKFIPRSVSLDYATIAFNEFEGVDLDDSKSSARPAVANSANPGSEGVLGFMDPVHRFNFCRSTALTYERLKEFQASLPFIRSTAELIKQHMPERYAIQLAACVACHPDYIIPGTPYSTLTLNRDTAVTCHTDRGDYKPGIGVLAATWAARERSKWKVVTENPCKGGVLVFPKYRVAVSLRTQDLLLCDVHEAHGVTFIEGTPGTWARLSFVFYLREKMYKCAGLAEEIARVSEKDTHKYGQGKN